MQKNISIMMIATFLLNILVSPLQARNQDPLCSALRSELPNGHGLLSLEHSLERIRIDCKETQGCSQTGGEVFLENLITKIRFLLKYERLALVSMKFLEEYELELPMPSGSLSPQDTYALEELYKWMRENIGAVTNRNFNEKMREISPDFIKYNKYRYRRLRTDQNGKPNVAWQGQALQQYSAEVDELVKTYISLSAIKDTPLGNSRVVVYNHAEELTCQTVREVFEPCKEPDTSLMRDYIQNVDAIIASADTFKATLRRTQLQNIKERDVFCAHVNKLVMPSVSMSVPSALQDAFISIDYAMPLREVGVPLKVHIHTLTLFLEGMGIKPLILRGNEEDALLSAFFTSFVRVRDLYLYVMAQNNAYVFELMGQGDEACKNNAIKIEKWGAQYKSLLGDEAFNMRMDDIVSFVMDRRNYLTLLSDSLLESKPDQTEISQTLRALFFTYLDQMPGFIEKTQYLGVVSTYDNAVLKIIEPIEWISNKQIGLGIITGIFATVIAGSLVLLGALAVSKITRFWNPPVLSLEPVQALGLDGFNEVPWHGSFQVDCGV